MHHAKIIAVTQPEQDLSVEEFIVYCARVSSPANQANHATAPKLMRYLMTHGHWSPFEMVSITMEIVTTRDIARQILRHRSFSFQEFSQRYADPTEALGFTFRQLRYQDKVNRQNSIVGSEDDTTQSAWATMQDNVMTEAKVNYDAALALGIAKEQARALLPEGLTVSRLYMAGTLRSWIHYCNVRTKRDTQAEHRIIADYAWAHIVTLCPSLEGLNDTE
jgi:thymidylate synthase (FAD)